MPRDAVAVTSLALNASVDQPAGTAINPTNGASIAVGGDASGVIVRINNTHATLAKIATVKAGVKPPAELASRGDLAESIALTGTEYLVLEGGRFVQADGTIWIDFEAAMTGTVMAFRLPQGG